MELTPKAHMILSRQNAKLSWADAFSEFIDNSFAPNKGGANAVNIEITRDTVRVWDNGQGMDNINRLFTLGDSSSYKDRTDIGLYGVGATDAILWIGPVVEAWNVYRGKVQYHRVDWDECRQSDRWPAACVADPQPANDKNTPDELQHPDGIHGLLISVRRRAGRACGQFDRLRDKLCERFGPGLRNDKQICISHPKTGSNKLVARILQPVPYPRLRDEIRFRGEVRGMGFTGVCGIMEPVDPHYNSFFFEFGHRVIEITTEPAKALIAASIHGRIELNTEWRESLSDHKSEVTVYRDELIDEIYEKCKPVLERARKESMTVLLENLSYELTEAVRIALAGNGTNPESTNESNGPGWRDPKPDPGPIDVPMSEEVDGDEQTKRKPRSALQVKFEEMGVPFMVAEVKDPPQLVITLSTTNPMIQANIHETPPDGLKRILWGIITAHAVMKAADGRPNLLKTQPLPGQYNTMEEFESKTAQAVFEALWPEKANGVTA